MTAAGGVASGGGSAGGVTGLPPMFTPIIFCLPSEGSSLSLNPLTSTSTSTSAPATTGDTSAASNQDGENSSTDQHPAEASKALPPALLPIANRPIIAFALQQLVSAGIRHAIICAPAAHHTLIAHTLRQLHLITHGTTTTTTTPNVQVLVDPLPGTSRRSNPSASTYILRLDLVPLGPADRTDKTRMSAAGTTASSLQPSIETNSRSSSSRKKNRVLGSAELLLWLASEGWLEADPLILPYDLLTPSLPLTALLRAHQIAAALLPSTNFAPGSGPCNSLPSHPLLLGATTLLIERRSPANTRSNGAKGDAASKERLKAEKSAFVGSGTQGDRLVVYSKEDFGALHGFSSSTLAAPHTGGFTSCPPSSSTTTTLIAEAPHSAHALLSSTPLVQAQSRSKSTSYVLPPGVGTQSLSSLHNQSRITASAHISTSLLDSGIYVLPRAIVLPLLERFSSPSPSGSTQPKIRTIPHLVSLLARASSDTRYARKMGIDNLVRRLARSFAQTHAQRAGLDPVRGVLRTGTTDGGRDSLGASISVAGVAAVGSGGGGGVGIGVAASLADSVQFGSAVASPNMLASPPTISTSRRPHLNRQSSASASSPSARAKDGQDESSSSAADALLAELGTSMSRLSVSIAAAHSSASRSSITGERSSTAVRPFSTPSSSSSSSGAAPAEIRVQALVARLETDAEAFVWGRADEVSAAGPVAGKGGKGAGGAGSAPQVEQERFLGKVDTPARYLEANRFLLRALAAPTPSPLFPIPSISEAGSLGTAPPIEGGAAPPSQPQITPDALIASHSSTTLGDRCVIRRSVVGKGCTVARGAKILGCVLMNGVSVGENAKLESVILGPHTTVGARSSLVDVDAGPEGVRIPDGTEAKATRFGNGVSGGGGAGAAGGGSGKKTGRGPQALGFDESAVVAGLLQDDDDDSEDSEEEESEEEDD
ncbi:hypothetical protein CF319_g7431 [Tilletia indica]|uniref:Translation initiation factor eIF2B subunit gamma n=1 Tax=Tilletia indica TaxID=43049 RepID=A0A177TUY6_9BASI|nr:hypothetical protein CF319_g7431 [Tilletia indica]KAE8242799.1 hypothetical protein A4X13_0g7005 [Tilletia indica]